MNGTDLLNKALLEAAREGRTADAVAHVKRGADVGAKWRDGRDALRIAADSGNPKLWRALIALGADPRAPGPDGVAPEKIRRERWAAGATWQMLLSACENASPVAVGRLCASEPGRLLGRDGLGRTALHSAAHAGRADNVEALTRAGGDPHEPDDLGRTPWLDLASSIFAKTRAEGGERRDDEERHAALVGKAREAAMRERRLVALNV